MRQTPKAFVYLLAISTTCVGLLFTFSNSVRSQEAKNVNPRIKELQQKQLKVLEGIRDVASLLFKNGRLEFDTVYSAQRELLAAQLASTTVQKDRLKMCDAAIENAVQWTDLAQARKEAARGNEVDKLKAQALMIEAQILREKVEAGE